MKHTLFLSLMLLSLTTLGQDQPDVAAYRKWFIPDHIKMQFAGNIGFISGGPGYVSKNKSLETDILLGFLPQKYGGDALVSLTTKVTYSPWRIHLKNNYNVAPFSIGFYSSHTLGPQFDTKWPEYYPKGYYWWATAIRLGAYVGGKVGLEVKNHKKIKGFEFYYEAGTYDLLLISYVQNTGYLRPKDILSLALGVKIAF